MLRYCRERSQELPEWRLSSGIRFYKGANWNTMFGETRWLGKGVMRSKADILAILGDPLQLFEVKRDVGEAGVGYLLRTTASISEAETVLSAKDAFGNVIIPDIMIVSLFLPDVGVFDWIASIKRKPQYAGMYIIGLVHLDRLSDLPRGYAAGADACYISGIDSSSIADAVRAFVTRSANLQRSLPEREAGRAHLAFSQNSGAPSMERHEEPVHTFLIVDADHVKPRLLRNSLSHLKLKNPIQEVTSVEDAISYLAGRESFGDRATHPFPLVVFIDLALPESYELLAWMEGHPEAKPQGIIVLTNTTDMRQVIQAYHLGAHTFLSIPPKPEDLRNALMGVPGARIISNGAESWVGTKKN